MSMAAHHRDTLDERATKRVQIKPDNRSTMSSETLLSAKSLFPCVVLLACCLSVSPFTIGHFTRFAGIRCYHDKTTAPFPPVTVVSSSSTDSSEATNLVDPSDMKLRDMKEELKGRGVSFADCFDRESVTRRLLEARSNTVSTPSTATEAVDNREPSTEAGPVPIANTDFDREGTLSELRALRVKELRTECAERNIRWANMIEKEDLVQALLEAREKSSNFSPSGALAPGKVTDINDEQLSAELKPGAASTPLLLDVYATWCGPCQMVAPQLVEAAKELGSSVRVAKIDSDKYPAWASKLRVGGLPTVIVFGATGEELQRVEGALMKDGLVQLARSHL